MNRNELRGLTGLGGHETEFLGLHPRQQAALAEARSVMAELEAGITDNHISQIGITSAREGVSDVYFAAIDKTGRKANELGYTPALVYMGEAVDLYEVPNGMLLTVGSQTSARCAVVMVTFHDVNESGYGDWNTALCDLVGIYADLDAAKAELVRFAKALRVMRTMAKQDLARAESKVDTKVGPAF